MEIVLISALIILLIVVLAFFYIDAEGLKGRGSSRGGFNLPRWQPLDRGELGEKQLNSILDKLPFEKEVYQNMIISKSEIDTIVLTRKGIFVFEMKNLSGRIYGDENKEDWVQHLGRNREHTFYNPIMQNAGHIKTIKHKIQPKKSIMIFSYIVFGYNCEHFEVANSTDRAKVMRIEDVKEAVTSQHRLLKNCMSEKEYDQMKSKFDEHLPISEALKDKYIINR